MSQLTIDDESTTTPHARKTFTRLCEQCGNEYQATLSTSRFCTAVCRSKFSKIKAKGGVTEPKTIPVQKTMEGISDPVMPKPEKVDRVPMVENLSPSMKIAVQLLQKDAERFEKLYEAQVKKREDAEAEIQRLKDQLKEKDHQATLSGIESAKPDFLDRVLSGLGSLPPQILEAVGPLIARVGNKIIPPEPDGQLQGGAQLDEMSAGLLNWIGNLSEENRENLFKVIGSLMNMDEEKLKLTLDQIINLLIHGTTIKQTQQQPFGGYDQSMYN